MKLLITTVSLLHFLVAVFGKSEKTYTFGKDCSVSIEHVDEDKSITVVYNGPDNLHSWCDYMSFIGRDDGYLNEYEICITPEVYDDPDCAVELTYREDYDGTPLKKYTCYDKPTTKYCGEQDAYMYIYLTPKSPSNLQNVQVKLKIEAVMTYNLKLKIEAKYTCYDKPTTKYCGEQDAYMYIYLTPKSPSNLQNVQVKLKIEAVMTYNYYTTIGIIIGSVIGGILVISVVIGVILCITCRGRRSPGQVMNPGTGVRMGQYQSPNASQPAGNYAPPLTGSYPTQPTGSHPT
ncbi:uncharacterized protein LOC127738974 [Mytilus californianus]|uniref:uncharacterized protein LOC127738974 n=1 Tax=Mytilus californianus TaxID=6549 RepID=UPI002245AB01|nr:uncharacterized protein LOC127738974 [Mytilus californianus]